MLEGLHPNFNATHNSSALCMIQHGKTTCPLPPGQFSRADSLPNSEGGGTHAHIHNKNGGLWEKISLTCFGRDALVSGVCTLFSVLSRKSAWNFCRRKASVIARVTHQVYVNYCCRYIITRLAHALTRYVDDGMPRPQHTYHLIHTYHLFRCFCTPVRSKDVG